MLEVNLSSDYCNCVCYLQAVVLLGVFCQQVLSALHVIGQLCLRQIRSKLLQHLSHSFDRHGKVLNGLLSESAQLYTQTHTNRQGVCKWSYCAMMDPLTVEILQVAP